MVQHHGQITNQGIGGKRPALWAATHLLVTEICWHAILLLPPKPRVSAASVLRLIDLFVILSFPVIWPGGWVTLLWQDMSKLPVYLLGATAVFQPPSSMLL